MINLLSSNQYKFLKKNMLKKDVRFFDIKVETQTFPDGEHYWRIEKPEYIRGKPAVYVCGTVDDAAIFDAYNMCCNLVREGCSELHLVIPYFGYSTMERAVKPGEAVTAKNVAGLLSSIPTSPQGNHVYMMDLHSQGTQYYFEKSIHPIHLTCWNVIKKMIADCGEDMVLASADMGRAKWIEKMGNELGVPTAYIMKKRISGSKTEIVALNAEVKDKDVVIFDDMIRSGSSIIKAAEAYKSVGARSIFVVCVHGVFVDGAIERFKKSGLIQKIHCINTHTKAACLDDPFVKVYDASQVIIDGLDLF